MKLIRLKLNEKFRSLQAGFEIQFQGQNDYDQAMEFNPYCLVGRNGSGKSNLLEALAAIFYHIECIYLNYRPEDFDYDEKINPNGYNSDSSFPDSYELEYFYPIRSINVIGVGENEVIGGPNARDVFGYTELNFAIIQIVKKFEKSPIVKWLNRAKIEPSNKERITLDRTEVKRFLPNFILGYSSGENEILSLPFFKMRFIHFDEYTDILTKATGYGGAPEGRLVFLDNQFSQAIVLCNFLMQDQSVLEPFMEEVGLEAISEFRLIIRKNHELDFHEEYLSGLSNEQLDDERNTKIELTNDLKADIEKLEKCATAKFYDPESQTLYLDYWVNDATRKAFRLHFGDPLRLFQSFQILLTLNLYAVEREIKKELYQSQSLFVGETIPIIPASQRILQFGDFLIKKRGIEDLIYSKSLSDGEHQFMHTLGLCLLFKDQPNLFLLDEPETHLNPDWRAKFITRLRQCFEKDKANEIVREMLITSHSPFIVSDSKEDYVLIFEKDDATNQVKWNRQEGFKTFGASVNQITLRIFDKPETIGGYAFTKLEELEKRFNNGEDGKKLIHEANKLLGDSVEKIMFINKILDTLENKD